MFVREYIPQFCNLSLRSLSLVAKLLLTLYMTRYLGLADLGVYGLVFAVVTTASALLGIQMEYVVVRDLVGQDPLTSLRRIRDQSAFYAINHLFFAVVMVVGWAMGLGSAKIILLTFFISVFDNIVGFLSANLVAMERPVLSTFVFFLRSGLWSFIAVGLGFSFPVLRTVDVVFYCWAFGCFLSVCVCLWNLRTLPRQQVRALPVDWLWVGHSVRKSVLIWLGIVASLLASNLDRFVVSYYLDMEKVGVLTFYGSFANALLGLVQSGFFAFSLPLLVQFYAAGNKPAFRQEATAMGKQVAVIVLLASIVLGVGIPFCAPLFGREELALESWTLWLLLLAVWVRANADTLYYVLYAQNKDKPLWLGGILVLFPATIANVLLVPLCGLVGVGYSALLASLFLLVWRIVYLYRPQ